MGTLLFVLAEDWVLLSHFQPMVRAAQAAGFRVVVATREGRAAPEIRALGCALVPVDISRGALDPLGRLRSVLALRRIIATERPDLVHAIALPAVVLTALATSASRCRPRVVLAPTGLGHLWLDDSPVIRLAREAIRALLKRVAHRRAVHFIFENPEDPREFGLDPDDPDKVTIVGGAGVSTTSFINYPIAAPPPLRVAVVARMTASKGIEPAVEAVRRLRAEGLDIRLGLYGAPDPGNRVAISRDTLAAWADGEAIVWHGHVDDIRAVWATSHVGMLLSWREGLPRALIEAMACGRPVVATDVVGCRSLVRDGIEGFLVPRDSVAGTMDALRILYRDPGRREAMGRAARQRVESGFTEAQVEAAVLNLYRRLAAPSPADGAEPLPVAR